MPSESGKEPQFRSCRSHRTHLFTLNPANRLVGNKLDMVEGPTADKSLPRIGSEDVAATAKLLECPFFLSSAKFRLKIEEPFELVARMVLKKLPVTGEIVDDARASSSSQPNKKEPAEKKVAPTRTNREHNDEMAGDGGHKGPCKCAIM